MNGDHACESDVRVAVEVGNGGFDYSVCAR